MAASHLLLKLLEGAPDRMGLALLSLAIAKEDHPSLDVASYLERIVALADLICGHLPPHPATGDILYTMNTQLFDEQDYNCQAQPRELEMPYLHHLLDARRGTPESLTILYMTLGRLLNLPMRCVSLSGHLLLTIDDGGEEDVIDPCACGVVLTRDELAALLAGVVGNSIGPQPSYQPFLTLVDDRALMVRMLRRHKEFHLVYGHYEEALLTVEMILDLAPESSGERLERARLLELLHRPEAAAASYLHYLERHPNTQWYEDLRLRTLLLLSKPSAIH